MRRTPLLFAVVVLIPTFLQAGPARQFSRTTLTIDRRNYSEKGGKLARDVASVLAHNGQAEMKIKKHTRLPQIIATHVAAAAVLTGFLKEGLRSYHGEE